MKILVCGAPCSETSEFVDAFVKKYPQYEGHVEKYSKETLTLDNAVDISIIDKNFEDHAEQSLHHGKDENHITEGGVVADMVMVYLFISMHAKDIDKSKMKKFTALFYYSVFNYDLILYLPIAGKIKRYLEKIEKEEFSMYASMDSFFDAICKQNERRNTTLFPFEESSGSPPMIRVPGATVDEQIDFVSTCYFDKDGQMDTVDVAPLTNNVINALTDPKAQKMLKN